MRRIVSIGTKELKIVAKKTFVCNFYGMGWKGNCGYYKD
jgi:hypothetical protein